MTWLTSANHTKWLTKLFIKLEALEKHEFLELPTSFVHFLYQNVNAVNFIVEIKKQ